MSESEESLGDFKGKDRVPPSLPIDGMNVRILKFDPPKKKIILDLYRGIDSLGEYRATSKPRRYLGPGDLPLEFLSTAFKDPVLKQLRSDVSWLNSGQIVKQGKIMGKQPLVYQGVAICQTAFDMDKFGNWYAGFQFSKDPGEWVVWIGSILIVPGLVIAFAVPFRAIGLTRLNSQLYLVGLLVFWWRDVFGSTAWGLIIVAGRTRAVRERPDRQRVLAGVVAC
jgi:cytochrome c biogenesis protein